jgi:hypothetical protein
MREREEENKFTKVEIRESEKENILTKIVRVKEIKNFLFYVTATNVV